MLVYITIIVPNSLRLSAIFSFCSFMGMTETILEDLSSLIIMYICLMLEQYPCHNSHRSTGNKKKLLLKQNKRELLFYYFNKCFHDILATIIKHIPCYCAIAIIAKHIRCGFIKSVQPVLFG